MVNGVILMTLNERIAICETKLTNIEREVSLLRVHMDDVHREIMGLDGQTPALRWRLRRENGAIAFVISAAGFILSLVL